jgi:GT2 family glycosyltransferase
MIAIIVLNYKNWMDTIECLESIFKSNYENYDLIVVDNCSPNNSREKLLAWANGEDEFDYVSLNTMAHYSMPSETKPLDYTVAEYCSDIFNKPLDTNKKITFIWSNQNNGYAAGNNIGIKYTRFTQKEYDYFWILNNDTVIESDTLGKLITYARDNEDKKYGIIGCDLFKYYDCWNLQGIGGHIHPLALAGVNIVPKNYNKKECEDLFKKSADYVVGASMFIKTNFIHDVGLMCEEYFLYYEEIDWSIRGKRKGWELGYCFESKIYHKEGASISGSDIHVKSDIADYYGIRNKIVFIKKCYPRKISLLIFSLFISFIIRLRPKYTKRAFRILSIIKQEMITFQKH